MKARFLLALCLATSAHADALHPLFRDGLWRHEFSGWLFPARMGPLARSGQPYAIDGNDDAAGALYGAPPGPSLVVELFGGRSADPRARFAGSQAAIAGTHPHLQIGPSQPFAVPGMASLVGQRTDFHAATGGTPSLRLYFLRGEDWVVNILVTGVDDTATADALVHALPWASLGSPERLH